MKTKISLFFLFILHFSTQAQNVLDAVKICETNLSGSARYMSMGGAFAGLGAEGSGIKDNPAGLGLFRQSEISTTINISYQNINGSWNNKVTDNNSQSVNLTNFNYIISNPRLKKRNQRKGLLSSNFSFNYNTLKNINRQFELKNPSSSSSLTDYLAYFTGNISSNDLSPSDSYQDVSIPWLSVLAYKTGLINEHIDTNTGKTDYWSSILPLNARVTSNVTINEIGKLNEYRFAWSGNFSNKYFIGTSINIESFYHEYSSQFKETLGADSSFTLNNYLTTEGNGLNIQVGTIVAPLPFLRLGASIKSPSLNLIEINNYARITSDLKNNTYFTQSPIDNYYSVNLKTPAQINLGLAFIIKQKALISGEYELRDYRKMEFSTIDGYKDSYYYENQDIESMLNKVQSIKFGCEYKPTPKLALRLGYNTRLGANKPNTLKWFSENTTRTDTEYILHHQTQLISGGIGYRSYKWYCDLGYVHQTDNETFFPYNSTNLDESLKASEATIRTTNNQLLLTFGIRY